MQLTHCQKLTGIATLAIVVLAIALVPGAIAQGGGSAAATTEQIRIVTVTQKGAAPSGPYPIVPARIPAFYGVYPSIGHGGTYNEDNGGAFGIAAVAWLKWQLMNDTTAKGKGYFVGSSCTLCANAQWKTDSRSLR